MHIKSAEKIQAPSPALPVHRIINLIWKKFKHKFFIFSYYLESAEDDNLFYVTWVNNEYQNLPENAKNFRTGSFLTKGQQKKDSLTSSVKLEVGLL